MAQRHKCKDCIFMGGKNDTLYCVLHQVYREPESRQITPNAFKDDLCDYQPLVEKAKPNNENDDAA